MTWNVKDSKTFIDFHKKYGQRAAEMRPKDMKKLCRALLIEALEEYRWKYESDVLGADDVLKQVFSLLNEYNGWKAAHEEEKNNRLCR